MKKLSKNSNDDKELEAVKEFIKKLPPEDLEKAVGGVSSRAKRVLIGMGFLAAATGTGFFLFKKFGKNGSPESSEDFREYKKRVDLDKISSDIIDMVGPENVYSKKAYFEDNGSQEVLKDPFIIINNKIYLKSQYNEGGWFSKERFNDGEKGTGVPLNMLS